MSPAIIENFNYIKTVISGRTTLETDKDSNIIITTDGLRLELYTRERKIGVFHGVFFRGNVFTTNNQGSEIRAGQTMAIVDNCGNVSRLTSLKNGFLTRPINSNKVEGYLAGQKLVTRTGVIVTGTLGGRRNSILNG